MLFLRKGAAANTYDAVWITPVLMFVDRFPTTLTLNAAGDGFAIGYRGAFNGRWAWWGQTIPAGVNFAIKAGNLLALLGNLPEEVKPAATEGTPVLDAARLAELAGGAVVLVEVK